MQIPAEFMPLFHRLLDASGALIRPLFRATGYEDKEDATPVTVADKGAEATIRAMLEKERPQDGIWGEEYGATRMDAEWTWIIDPIDGTKAFIRGMPLFATLLGLMHQGPNGARFVLGAIDQPVLRERWVGGAGHPTLFNGAPVRTRRCAGLKHAVLNATTPAMFKGNDAPRFNLLADNCKYALWGGDAYAYALLASGHIDLVVEAQLRLHDFAALAPVIAAAGGTTTDWQGKPLSPRSDGRIIAAGDPTLIAPALAFLRD